MVCLSSLVGIYYNVIIAYTVFYFFSSLSTNLPWETCGNFWNNKTTCSTEFSKHTFFLQKQTNFEFTVSFVFNQLWLNFILGE